jgi:hypothetical protein
MLKTSYNNCKLKAPKISPIFTSFILFVFVLGFTQKLTAQTEVPEDTIPVVSDYFNKVYDETYAVDTIEFRDTLTVNLNDSLEIDSFELRFNL